MMMTRLSAVALATLVACSGATSAGADGAICLNPKKTYEARVLGSNAVFARNTLGGPGPGARIETSCVALEGDDRITLSTSFACVGRGDPVVATTIDGRQRACVVTSVTAAGDSDG